MCIRGRTQWKKRFEFQVYGELGAVEISGLGGSYGVEQMTVFKRPAEGGAPDVERNEFPGKDVSWEREWAEFKSAVTEGRRSLGSVEDGVSAMRLIDAMYRSSQTQSRVSLR